MARSYRPADLHAAGAASPLELAAQGFFWTGGEVVDHPQAGQAMRGELQRACEAGGVEIGGAVAAGHQ